MQEYQLELKQIVEYPRCRIYRQFIRALMTDCNIRVNGDSSLFYYTVLCSYANFRTSYKRIGGINYTIYPGEWVCTLQEISTWFRTRLKCQAISVLENLQEQKLITFSNKLGRGNIVKFKIKGWRGFNTILDYNAPCQKDTGFFFLPISKAAEIISTERCSEMDILLDLWLNTIYNDEQVQGSEIGPVFYLRNGTGAPLVGYTDLAMRWGISKSTVGRILKKFEQSDYISLLAFPGRHGSVIYLNSFISTMFQLSDVMIDKEEVAMSLNIKISTSDIVEINEETDMLVDDQIAISDKQIIVSNNLISVPNFNKKAIILKVAEILSTQRVPCCRCSDIAYKLSPLLPACGNVFYPQRDVGYPPPEEFILEVSCKRTKTLFKFELTIVPIKN